MSSKPDRVTICDVYCLGTKPFMEEFLFETVYAVEMERKIHRLPYIKLYGLYYYPVDLCHRFYAGEDVSGAIRHLEEQIHRNFVNKVPKDLWIVAGRVQ